MDLKPSSTHSTNNMFRDDGALSSRRSPIIQLSEDNLLQRRIRGERWATCSLALPVWRGLDPENPCPFKWFWCRRPLGLDHFIQCCLCLLRLPVFLQCIQTLPQDPRRNTVGNGGMGKARVKNADDCRFLSKEDWRPTGTPLRKNVNGEPVRVLTLTGQHAANNAVASEWADL